MSSASAFTDILRRELDGMQQLSSILGEEFAAMSSGDADALERVMSGKSAVLTHLQEAASARMAALQAAGVAVSREAVEAWLRAAGGSADGLVLWQELLQLTREVHGNHQTNQALLEGLMRHNQQALDLLTRLANPDLTYQSDGSTIGSFGKRNRGLA